MTDGQSIRHGADFFLARRAIISPTGGKQRKHRVLLLASKAARVLKRNGKEYERLSDHVGLVPAVIVSPAGTAP